MFQTHMHMKICRIFVFLEQIYLYRRMVRDYNAKHSIVKRWWNNFRMITEKWQFSYGQKSGSIADRIRFECAYCEHIDYKCLEPNEVEPNRIQRIKRQQQEN